jgi:hypothetical protein
VEYRVDQLAEASGLSVDTIRFYQSRRDGRVGWYDDEHIARLDRIRDLQAKGFTLSTIRRLLNGELDAADEALVAAVSDTGRADEDVFGIEELARRSGIPAALLQTASDEGLLAPEWGGFTDEDVDAAKAALALLEQGVPVTDLLALAKTYHKAARVAAERAVELFDGYVRKPLRAQGLSDDVSAARLVDAYQRMLPATTTLITQHFTRTLLAVAFEHIEKVGDEAELRAVREARA